MRSTLKTCLSVTAVGALALGLGPAFAIAYDGGGSYGGSGTSFNNYGDRLNVVGLSDGTRLSTFSTDDAGRVSYVGRVALSGDTTLIGIDYRVQNGALYGVGNAGGNYKINATNAVATKVGGLTVALSGVNFGVDFNPAANALRVISDTGQNLRQPFPAAVNGVFSDGPVAATANDGTLNVPNGAATPVPGAPATGVTGAAYSNNDLDTTTGTTLFDINTANDTVAIQAPANSGFLNSTGSLGVDFAANSGFDVYSKVRPMNTGKAVQLFPYAVSNGSLYSINLLNGQADSRGLLGDASITDIAIPLNQL